MSALLRVLIYTTGNLVSNGCCLIYIRLHIIIRRSIIDNCSSEAKSNLNCIKVKTKECKIFRRYELRYMDHSRWESNLRPWDWKPHTLDCATSTFSTPIQLCMSIHNLPDATHPAYLELMIRSRKLIIYHSPTDKWTGCGAIRFTAFHRKSSNFFG